MRRRILGIVRGFLCAGLLLCALFAGCVEKPGTSALDAHQTGEMELRYATQFRVREFEEDYRIVDVEDGLRYLLVPPGKDGPPGWMSEAELADCTVITLPADQIYLAASSAMDLVAELDGLDAVRMTSTQASDWSIPEIRDLVEEDEIHYVGKYSAPDYEALVEEEVALAIESTMIYHSPQIKEELEALGIPVLVERSSYESDPLGRLEWVRLYGLLLGKEREAEAFFSDVCYRLDAMMNDPDQSTAQSGTDQETPSVAFFSIQPNGSVVVRKPGDYVTRMIEMAGGRYALSDLEVGDDNALSTMNLQMEAFYEMARDADFLIYNSAIEGDLKDIPALLEKAEVLADCKAVQEGHVWCTNKNVYQRSGGICDMILEMHGIFGGAASDEGMEYFHRLD